MAPKLAKSLTLNAAIVVNDYLFFDGGEITTWVRKTTDQNLTTTRNHDVLTFLTYRMAKTRILKMISRVRLKLL